VNEAAVAQYGYSREELLQKSVLDLRLPEDQEKLANYLYQLRTEKADGPAGIWRHRLRNGDLIYMQIFLHRIMYTNENAVMVIAQNVTDKVLLEKKLADERNLKQQQMTEAIIGAQETERAQIGRELHDNVNQILGAVRLYITAAMQESEPQKIEFLKKASSYTLRAIDEIRELSKNLLSPDLQYMGLENAVVSLAEDIMLAHPFTIVIQTNGFDEIMLSEKFKLNIFRIIQEQLNNIIKHANANNITICMSKCEDEITITITDDGKGFDTLKKRNGVGLSNIQSRAEFYKGDVEITSSPGNGCRLKLVFPVMKALNDKI
jgi:PAS domain S-box-containing protein